MCDFTSYRVRRAFSIFSTRQRRNLKRASELLLETLKNPHDLDLNAMRMKALEEEGDAIVHDVIVTGHALCPRHSQHKCPVIFQVPCILNWPQRYDGLRARIGYLRGLRARIGYLRV
jgi:hypothetical protein